MRTLSGLMSLREGGREGGTEGERNDERQRVKGTIQNEELGLIALHVQVCTYMYIHVYVNA